VKKYHIFTTVQDQYRDLQFTAEAKGICTKYVHVGLFEKYAVVNFHSKQIVFGKVSDLKMFLILSP
jgi:hypothetical protein